MPREVMEFKLPAEGEEVLISHVDIDTELSVLSVMDLMSMVGALAFSGDPDDEVLGLRLTAHEQPDRAIVRYELEVLVREG